jgi:hypothetical protein
MIWYVRPPSGGQFGPATGDVMRNWLTEGRVSTDSLVWREGWRDWQEAGQVFSQLRVEPALDFLGSADVSETFAAAPASFTTHPLKSHREASSAQFTVIVLLVIAVVLLSAIFLFVVFHS